MKLVADRTSFMKIMIQDFAEQLELPPAFVKNMGRRADGEYQIRVWGSGGSHCWIVEVEKDRNGLFFRKGWPEFLADNNVRFADVLVFIYERRYKFLVKIFDPSGLKRNMDKMIPKEEDDVDAEAPDEGNGDGDDELMSVDLDEPPSGLKRNMDKMIPKEEDDVDVEAPDEGNGDGDDELMSVDLDEPPIFYVDNEGECHLEVGREHENKKQESMEPTQEEGLRRMEVEGEKEKETHDCATPTRRENLDFSVTKGVSEQCSAGPSQIESSPRFEEGEKESVKESSVLPPFSSSNTHFIVTWSPTWLQYLTIPREVAIEKDLHIKSQLLIRDPRGKIWFMKLSKEEDGTINLTKEWSKFCKCFGLEEGDTCTFEFTSSRIVHVHISAARLISHAGQ